MTAKNIISFNDTVIKRLPLPVSGRVDYRDEKNLKLTCRVASSGSKTFAISAWQDGTSKRITVGKFPDINVTVARKMASVFISKMTQGVDLNQIKKTVREKAISLPTLSQVLERYIETHNLKVNTIKDYRYKISHDLANLSNTNVDKITMKDVVNAQIRLTKISTSTSNAAMRVLKLTLNHAVALKIIESSPAEVLTTARLMHKAVRKQRIIPADSLSSWLKSVNSLDNYNARVYLLTLLFTGLRKEETITMEWRGVDLKKNTIKILDTKTSDYHTFPIPSYLNQYYQGLKIQATSHYVFSSKNNAGEVVPISVPRCQIVKVTKETGVKFSPHDLRRTFATISEAVGLPTSMTKRLMNHGVGDTSDVTNGYIISEEQTIREAINKIAEYITSR